MTGATAGAEEQPGDVKGMSMEDMLKMRQALEDQIKSLEGGYGGAATTVPGNAAAGKFTSAAQLKQEVLTEQEELDDADSGPLELRRLTVGQMYQVCHKFVAVRSAPALDAPFLRRLGQGTNVELFEWDRSRRWRRMVVEMANDAFKSKKSEGPSEIAKRLASENPVWDNEKQCWTDGEKKSKIEILDESDEEEEEKEESIVHTDGWVMVQHPEFGLLVEAVGLATEEDIAATAAKEPAQDTQKNTTRAANGAEVLGSGTNRAVPELVSKDQIFDYYWGTSDIAPPNFYVEQQRQQQQLQAAAQASSSAQLGESKVMVCARENDYESLRELLQTGADPNASDTFGETPLFEASLSGNLNILALLLVTGADSAHVSEGEMTATAVAADAPTKALLEKWQRLDCAEQELLAALQRVDTRDLAAVEDHCGVSLEELQRSAETRSASSPSRQATSLHTTAAVQPVRYRVIYKKVAVRQEPNTKSPALRQVAQGEIVEMFEWDASQSFRRVRILAIRDADDGGGMQETDGWMLISSPSLGPLLQEVIEGEEDEAGEEDLAG